MNNSDLLNELRIDKKHRDNRVGSGSSWLMVSVLMQADGRFDLRYKLWDTIKGEELLGRSTVVPAPDLRLAAHRISDEIYKQLTGERGVFATRIAYVVKAG